ncbi:hypothetical protein FAVG1_00316 [Fusarium avenaceum]|nr:hypothetical protein FAVG1_00316 [Fusarium avenaceum]
MSIYVVPDPEELQEFISTSFDTIPLAHIRLPLYREPGFESKVITSFPGDGIFLLVTSTEDISLRESSISNLERPTVIISFIQFLGLLSSTRKPIPGSRDAWDTSLSGAEAIAANILPKDATVLFMIDSSMPADCALALHGALQWTLDSLRYPDTTIRILTMSTVHHHTLVSDLVHLRVAKFEIPSLDLSLEGMCPDDQAQKCYEDGAIVADICDVIVQNAGTSQLVISFADENFNSKLYDDMTKASKGLVKRVNITNRMGQDECLATIKSPPIKDVTIHLCLPGDFPLVPQVFDNYEQIYVVLDGRLSQCQAWHYSIHQVVGFDRYASYEQVWQQLWWCQQEATKRRTYTRNEDIDDFLQGAIHHHQVIENAQLGGFIASIYDRGFWGIDILETLECFITYPARTDQMTRRLETQGILSKGEFGLKGSEADAFRAILPLVDYDHRLALFACLDSNPIVRGVKLELISVLTVGIHNIVAVNDAAFLEILHDRDLHHKFFSACMGPSRSLARCGGMWLALGLWRRYSLDEMAVNSSPEEVDFTNWLNGYLEPLETNVNNVTARVKALHKALVGVGISVQDSSVHLHYQLDETETFEILTHLFHAFMFQLTVVRQGQEHPTHLLYPAMMDVHKRRTLNLNLLIDEATFLRVEHGECVFGISHSMTRDVEKKVFLEDWTWVPAWVVATWMVDNAPDSDITSLLLDTTDDVDENIGECTDGVDENM